MNSSETSTPERGLEPTAEMSFGERLTGVYFEPAKTFHSVDRKPTWLGMYILVAILTVGVTYALTMRMDYRTYMTKAMQMNPLTRNLSEEQLEQILAREPGAFQRYSGIFFAPIGVLVGYLILATVFLVVFILMGASIGFRKSMAATVWGMGPPGIIVAILGIVFVMVKDPQTLDINVVNNVVSNLGPLVSSKDQPFVHSLLSSIDLFSIWTIYLLSVGFAAVSDRKLTPGKAATGIVVLWLLWVVGKAGFAGWLG